MSSFFSQLGWELYRMFARPRTYIGFGIFLLFELFFYLLWSREKSGMEKFINKLSGGADEYFSAITFGFMILIATMFLLGVIFVSLVSGDIVAKETEDGNLRLLLVRPVSRIRLLTIKFIACQIYTLTLFVFVGITALGFGILSRGWGGGFLVWAPELPKVSLFGWNEGLLRYFVAILVFSLFYLPISGIAFFLSCLKIKPAAATTIPIGIILADSIFFKIPLPILDDFRPYLMTARINGWLYLFYENIPWASLLESAAWLMGFGLTGFAMGCIVFARRDIKS